MIRRERPITEILDETVMLGILMNVGYQTSNVPSPPHRDPAEGMLNKTSRSKIGMVDGFGVCIEEIPDLLSGRWYWCLYSGRIPTDGDEKFRFSFYSKE
jgi:hypothetical protein